MYWLSGVSKLKWWGSSSPGWMSVSSKLIVFPLTRGGVPVLNRSRSKPRSSRFSDSLTADLELFGPDWYWSSPMMILPRAAVPTVRTTVLAW